jgi:hypothetical protein
MHMRHMEQLQVVTQPQVFRQGNLPSRIKVECNPVGLNVNGVLMLHTGLHGLSPSFGSAANSRVALSVYERGRGDKATRKGKPNFCFGLGLVSLEAGKVS